MRVNRLDMIRVLKIVKSIDAESVKFEEDGKFSVLAGTAGILYGKGLNLGRKLGLGNVDKLMKLLEQFPDIEVNVNFEDSKVVISGGKSLVYWYRLTAPEHIKNDIIPEKVAVINQGEWIEGTFGIEELMEIKKLLPALDSEDAEVQGNLTFFTDEGRLKCTVGSKTRNGGQIELGDLKLPVPYSFWVSKIVKILNVLDESRVKVAFRVDDKKLVRFQLTGFTWILGALIEEKEEPKVTK